MPNAQIAVKNAEHGINRTGMTNDSGDYLFASLPIGSYDLIVTSPGFKKYEAKGVVLRVAEKARINVPLEVGAISTEVVVQGSEVAQVETQSSDLGNAVNGQRNQSTGTQRSRLHATRCPISRSNRSIRRG